MFAVFGLASPLSGTGNESTPARSPRSINRKTDKMASKIKKVDSLVRRVMVGTLGYLYDTMYIEDVETGNERRVPVYPSYNGEERYLQDIFQSGDAYCEELKFVEGSVNKLPFGVLKLLVAKPMFSENMQDFVTMKHYEEVKNSFGDELREISSSVKILPIVVSFEVSYRFDNEFDRLLAFDQYCDLIAGVNKYFISFKSFPRIPCSLFAPEDLTSDRTVRFNYDQPAEKRLLTANFEVLTWKPVVDRSTSFHQKSRIETTGDVDLNITDGNAEP